MFAFQVFALSDFYVRHIISACKYFGRKFRNFEMSLKLYYRLYLILLYQYFPKPPKKL